MGWPHFLKSDSQAGVNDGIKERRQDRLAAGCALKSMGLHQGSLLREDGCLKFPNTGKMWVQAISNQDWFRSNTVA